MNLATSFIGDVNLSPVDSSLVEAAFDRRDEEYSRQLDTIAHGGSYKGLDIRDLLESVDSDELEALAVGVLRGGDDAKKAISRFTGKASDLAFSMFEEKEKAFC